MSEQKGEQQEDQEISKTDSSADNNNFSIGSDMRREIVLDVDKADTYLSCLTTHLASSEQEWCMLLEACLRFQLRQHSPSAGLNNLGNNITRLLERENVDKDNGVLHRLMESSVFYMRAVLVKHDKFSGFPIEAMEQAISRMASVIVSVNESFLKN